MPKKNDFKLDVVSVRLVKDAPIYSEHTFNNPADIAAVMGDCMCQFDREVVCVVNLRSDLKPINVHFASVGSLNEAMAHPRELFKSSILSNAARKITTAGDKKYAYYICSNHKLTKQCSQHSISVSLLEDTVLEMLKLHIKNVMNLEEILDYIGKIPFQQLDVKSLEARKQKKLEEVEKCKRLKTSLYEDMKDGILTKEEYLELHEAYLKKAKEGEEIIRQIERDIALILEEKDDKHLWMNYFTEYKDIKELTRDVVVKLISEVRVSENKEIEIVFDFDDCYKKLLESVEKLGYQVDKEPGGQLNISRREAV